jgi:anti-sigma regulatory factor (Ser/Thr protein kinase)
MTDARSFPASLTAVAAARAYVDDQMRGSSPRVASVAKLLVSELASNAVTHARTPFTVSVQRDGLQTRVEVCDTGGGEPCLRPVDPLAPNGRGLQLLGALAESWGVERNGGPGKRVWFLVCDAERD